MKLRLFIYTTLLVVASAFLTIDVPEDEQPDWMKTEEFQNFLERANNI